ncbi:MAG: hypothetical protein ACFB16_23415 [Phormidesmis sp.]
MKLKPLSVALFTLALVALVPVVKMATAQPEPVSLEEKLGQWHAKGLEQSKICEDVFQEEANGSFEGNYFFDDFKGLNLTDEQRSTYDSLMTQADAKRTELFQNTVSIINPTASLSFKPSADFDSVPQDIQSEIQEALNKNPTIDQKEALDRKFGQYGEFLGSYITYITPEQEAQRTWISENFYAQVQDIMTAEQLSQYRKLLTARLRIDEVCGSTVPVSSERDLGRVITGSSSAWGQVVDTIPELLQ